MNLLLRKERVEEYITIVALIVIVSLSAILTVFENNDISDILVITVIVGLVALFLFFWQELEPAYVLYTLCLGVSFLPYINLDVFPLSGVYIIALLFIGLSLATRLRSKGYITIPPQAKWMTALLGIGILSAFVAPDKKAVFIYGAQFFIYICIYTAIANILDSKPKIIRALKYIIYGSVVTIILSGIQFILSLFSINRVVSVFFDSVIGNFFIGTRGLARIGDNAALIINRGSNIAESSNFVLFRVFGTFEGPTIFGWYLLVIGILAGGMLVVQFRKKRVGLHTYSNAALFFLVVLCLLFTWTRSALLIFFIAFIFILIYRNERNVRIFTPKVIRLLAVIIAIPLVWAGVLYLYQVPIIPKVIAFLNIKNLGESTITRLLTMLFAISYFMQNPIVGIGMGNYEYVQPSADIAAGGASSATAHNTYLELGVELGLPGLIVFLFLLHSFVKEAALLTKASVDSFYHTLGIVFFAVWIGFILVSLFGGNLIHPRFMTLLWIIAGIQTASCHLYLNDKKKEHTVYRLEAAD